MQRDTGLLGIEVVAGASVDLVNRVKTDLTDAGVVDIEKQSGHVGRPRQILTLPPNLAGRSRAALLDAVRDALSD